jgi:predicted ribosomally synthesized peptide with SipW-like signal peptide
MTPRTSRSGAGRGRGRASSRAAFPDAGVWAVAAAAVLVAAVSVIPGSLALWNDADAVDAGTVTAGELNAAIAPGTTTPTTDTTAALGALTGLIPGESRGVTFTVRNTGNVPIQIAAARAASTNQYLLLDLAAGACPATPPAGTALSATPANVGTPVAPATNAAFCLRVTLDVGTPAALQGAPVGPYQVDLTAGVR